MQEGYFFALFCTFLFGCFVALVAGLGIPRLLWWLEERRLNASSQKKSRKGRG